MVSKIFIGLAISALLYFLIAPGPYDAVPYPELPPLPDYTPFILDPNEASNLHIINHPNLQYPEDLFVEHPYIYVGGYKGKLYQLDPVNQIFKVVVQTSGQIMKIEKQGDIFYFLDMEKGICKYDSGKDELEVIISNKDYKFLDSFDISKDGVIYFSDASSKYDLENYAYDIYEGRPYGSLHAYDLKTNKTTLLLADLYFANGVQLSPDQSVVYVAETGRFRVRRYYLTGDKKGQTDILIDNLPGVPDNLRFNAAGELWIAQPQMRDAMVDYTMKTTFLRNLFGKLPLSILLPISRIGTWTGGVKVNEKGEVLEFFRVPCEKFRMVTTVLETNNTLYLGTIQHTDIGIVARTKK